MMTKMRDSCILCFVKYPEKGQVKLRLTADLREDIVVELYKNFVEDLIATLGRVDTAWQICFFPPDAKKKFQQWLGPSFTYAPQQGNNLGERMKNSFSSAFAEGLHRVVLIGSDSPDLPVDFLHTALRELRTHDIVLGPSSDGGYYLIGFRDNTFQPSLFDDISWSSTMVFKETMVKIKNIGKSVCLLPVWSDVDTIVDLKNLINRSKNTAFKSSHTITYLQQHERLMEVRNEPKSNP